MTTKKQIMRLLAEKGLYAKYIEYRRGCPTPDGHCGEWTIVLDDCSKKLIHMFESNLMSTKYSCEFNGTRFEDPIRWIKSFPDLRIKVSND